MQQSQIVFSFQCISHYFLQHYFRDFFNTQTEIYVKPTSNANARSAGIGMMAAMKKAQILLKDVNNTLTPVLFKHSPVCSWSNKIYNFK